MIVIGTLAANAAAVDLVVVNTASQPNLLPAETDAAVAGALAQATAVTDGREVYPVDVVEGRVYVGVRVPAMETLPLSITRRQPAEPSVDEENGAVNIRWPNGAQITADAKGMALNGRRVVENGGDWSIGWRGRGVVILRQRDTVFTCFASGAVSVQCAANQTLQLVGRSQKIRRANSYLVPLDAEGGSAVDPPFDTVTLADDCLFVPTSKGWRIEAGSLRTTNNEAEGYFLPVDDEGHAHRDAALLTWSGGTSPLIALPVGNGWQVRRGNWLAGVVSSPQPRSPDDLPNLSDSAWLWCDSRGDGIGAWVFTPANEQRRWPVWQTFKLDRVTEGQRVRLHSARGVVEARLPGTNSLAEPMDIQPEMTLTDWSGTGRFIQGDLMRGGCVASAGVFGCGALDLDADGDGDVYIHSIREMTEPPTAIGGYKFDMTDQMHGYFLLHAPQPGRINRSKWSGYTEHIGPYTWMFSKSLESGRFYKNAGRGFEEHILYRIKRDDESPLEGTAAFFFKTTGDKIDRLAMGAFGAGDSMYMGWNIELDPLEASQDQPAAYRICEYRDPYGNRVRFTSPVYPEQWDGGPLPLKQQGDRGIDFSPFAGWYRVAKENLFDLYGVKAVFCPQGTYYISSEGMYGGALTTGQRMEMDIDASNTFRLYYSDLMGDLHLLGAEYGYQGFAKGHPINRHKTRSDELYHRESLEPRSRWFAGREEYQLEGCRIEGPMYMAYYDLSRDGYMDTYLYDADNDGLMERVLSYDGEAGLVTLHQDDTVAAWSYRDEPTTVDYLPENYNRIEALSLAGATSLPMVISTELSSSGLPIRWVVRRANEGHDRASFPAMAEERPEFCVIAGPSWQHMIAIDLAHGTMTPTGWTDFTEYGFSGLSLQAAGLGLTCRTSTQRWSAQSLADVDVLIIADAFVMPDRREMAALRDWIESGGILMVVPGAGGEASRLAINGIVEPFGAALTDTHISARSSIFKYGLNSGDWNDTTAPIEETRSPSFDQQIEHFTSSRTGLLDGLELVTCVGYAMDIGDAWESVLQYDGQTVVARRRLGEGWLFVSSMDLFANRYLNHMQHPQPLADNPQMVRRLMACAVEDLPLVSIGRMSSEDGGAVRRFVISGRGGEIRMPSMFQPCQATVNDKPLTVTQQGLFDVVDLPSGTSRVTIKMSGDTP
jgi:hypothetical protein